MMAKLGWPLLLCHRLDVTRCKITGYRIRQPDPKRQSVKAFQSLRYRVLAVGDSYNDIPMLDQADHGFFYRCPAAVAAEYPQFPCAQSYAALQQLLAAIGGRVRARKIRVPTLHVGVESGSQDHRNVLARRCSQNLAYHGRGFGPGPKTRGAFIALPSFAFSSAVEPCV